MLIANRYVTSKMLTDGRRDREEPHTADPSHTVYGTTPRKLQLCSSHSYGIQRRGKGAETSFLRVASI